MHGFLLSAGGRRKNRPSLLTGKGANMTPQEVVNNIKLGDVISWIAFIVGVIGLIIGITIKLYKIFEKYKKTKDKAAEQEQIIQRHEDALNAVNLTLQELNKKQDVQLQVMLKQISHEIVMSCETALTDGSISFDGLESLTGLYDIYHNVYNQNSYVTALMDRVKILPVIK